MQSIGANRAKGAETRAGRLTCRCLNVAVHYKGDTWGGRAVEGEKLFPSRSQHPVRRETLHEIDLDVAGVTTEHSSLLLTHSVGDWVVHSCSNCGNHVYVTHQEKSRVFVCEGLLVSDEAVSQVKGHQYYSSVFRITLDPNLEEEEVAGRRRVSSMGFGREDPAVRAAHSQVKGYLAREEEEMEARVRDFERREKAAFSRLQQKTFRERTLLFAAIAKAREGALADPQSNQPKKPTHPHPTPPTHTPSHPHKQKVTITLSDPRPLVVKPSQPPLDDALFSLDGFDEFGMGEDTDGGTRTGMAFPQSDDEEISTDDSSYRDMSSVHSIASSVPVSVPMFQPSEQHQSSFHDEVDPLDMANSIKALALSVQDTGMFGDLPRPRVNSDA